MIDRIGINLYTLRELMKTPADIASTLKKVKEIGYPSVQISGIGSIEPKELKKITDDLGLVISATHNKYADLMNDLDTVVEKHKIWNCTQAAISMMPTEFCSAEGYVKFAGEMSLVGEKLLKHGITFSYHNHSFEFERFNGKTGLELIYENSDPKYFQAEIDTYWVQHGGGDPVAWCERMAGRLPLVHLKDYAIVNRTPTFMEVGEGNLDMAAIVKACKEAGCLWYLVEQDVCRRPQLESAAISYRNLKQLLQSVA